MHCKRDDNDPKTKKLVFVFDLDDLRDTLRDANGEPLPIEDEEDLEWIADGVVEELGEMLDWEFEKWALAMYERVYG